MASARLPARAGAAPPAARSLDTEPCWQAPFTPFTVRESFALQQMGPRDATSQMTAQRLVRLVQRGDDVAAWRIEARDGQIAVHASSSLRDAAARWAAVWPPDDGHERFAPSHPVLATLHRRSPGLRLLRVPWLFELTCSVILQQRVRFVDAMRQWNALVRRHGKTSDAGAAFPSAERLAGLAAYELPALGIDSRRGRTLQLLAREEVRRPFLTVDVEHAVLRQRLSAIPGIGPWTLAMVLGFGAGDPDAVPVGDVHLPRLVTQALGGPVGGDDEMLRQLEPFRGHRFRVVRLIVQQSMPRPG